MKASSLSRQIKFTCNPIFSKWAKPNIYGSGKLYELTRKESGLQHKSTGPGLLTYNPYMARIICKRLDRLTKPKHLKYKRHLIEMPDGGKVAVDQLTDDKAVAKDGYPIIVYTTTGGTTSYSARSKITASWFLEAGYPNIYIVNRRSSGGVPQYSPQISLPYEKYNDTADIMDYLTNKEPGKRWILIASCFGAQRLLDFFTQPISNKPEYIGGIVDSFMFNGKKFLTNKYTSDRKLVTEMRAYEMHMFIDDCLNHAANKDVYDKVSQLVDRKKFENIDLTSVKTMKTVYEDLVCKMCPDAPFSTEQEFWAMVSPYYDQNNKNFLKMKKPVVLIYAQDDFVCPFDMEEIEALEENPNLCLWLYPGGGHGSFSKSVFPYRSYLKDFYLENLNLLMRNF